MNTILEQQLELHFADDDYHKLRRQASNYVKGLISRHNWWRDSRSLVETEGPLSRMVSHLLVLVIEKGDYRLGCQAYTSYLSELYGASNGPVAKAFSLDALPSSASDQEVIWSTLGKDGDENPLSKVVGEGESFPPFGEEGSPFVNPSGVFQTPYDNGATDRAVELDSMELEFMDTYASVGRNLKEAAKLCGISEEEAYKIRNRVRLRANHQPKSHEKTCAYCEVDFLSSRRDAKFCSESCRSRFHYAMKKQMIQRFGH